MEHDAIIGIDSLAIGTDIIKQIDGLGKWTGGIESIVQLCHVNGNRSTPGIGNLD